MQNTNERAVYGNIPFAVPYLEETKLITLSPEETKIYHGLCVFLGKSGSACISDSKPGFPVMMDQRGFIWQAFFRVIAGKEGCTFSLSRSIFN